MLTANTTDDEDSTMSLSSLQEAIIEYITENEGVTFVELEELLGEYIEVKGTTAFFAGKREMNIIFWAEISDAFYNVVAPLITNREIYLHPESAFDYWVEGRALGFDIAEHPPANGYEDIRWRPVCFYSYPPEKQEE